jgi:ABC-type transport system substrate-binding protein
LSDREARRQRLNRAIQTVAFVGALGVLAVVIYTAVMVQSQHQGAGPVATVRSIPTPYIIPTAAPTPGGPAYSDIRVVLPPGSYLVQDEPRGVLDPAWLASRAEAGVPAELFLGLTAWSSGTLQPALAASWDVSTDGLAYTFHLRRDVFWVDCDVESRQVRVMGQVTATDVVASIERAVAPETGAPNAALLDPILGARQHRQGNYASTLGVAALDPATVRFTLTSPLPSFPELLADPVAWPIPADRRRDYPGGWTKPGLIWTDGPFCPVAWEPRRTITLVPNPFLPWDLWTALYRDRIPAGAIPAPSPAVRGYPRPLATSPPGPAGAYPTSLPH